METKQLSGGKLYVIIVAAFLTCAGVIGSLVVVNAVYKAKRQRQADRATANHDKIKSREDQIFYLAEQIPGGFDLYFDYYMRLTQDTTEEEKRAKLDEIEAKLKQMQQAQLEREPAQPNRMQSPSPKAP